MPKTWSDIANSAAYQSLSAGEQSQAREQYFDSVVAPQVPVAQVDVAKKQFMSQTTDPKSLTGYINNGLTAVKNSIVGEALSTAGEGVKATAQTAASFATSFPAMAAGVIAAGSDKFAQTVGVGTGISPHDVASSVYNHLHYTLTAKNTKELLQTASIPFTELSKVGDKAKDELTYLTGSPLVGEIGKAAIESSPVLLGLGKMGKESANAPEAGIIQEGGAGELPRVPPRENIPTDTTQVREGQGQQANGGSGAEPSTQEAQAKTQEQAAQDLILMHSGLHIPQMMDDLRNQFVQSGASALLDSMQQRAQLTGNLENDVYSLENQKALLQQQGTQYLMAAKEAGLTPEIDGKLFDYAENPTIQLNDKEQMLWDKYIQPLRDHMALTEGYIQREAMGKGGVLERITAGVKNRIGQGVFRTSQPWTKHRIYKVVVDPKTGDRTLVRIDDRQGNTLNLTKMDNNVETPIGRVKLTENENILDQQLAPYASKINSLQKELSILTRSKSRAATSQRRIGTIQDQIAHNQDAMDQIKSEFNPSTLNERSFWSSGRDPITGKTVTKKKYIIRDATANEVEQNTNTRYYKSAFGSTVNQLVNMGQTDAARAFFEDLKNSPDIKQHMSDTYVAGFEPVNIAQLQGKYFSPHVANVLNYFASKAGYTQSPLDLGWLTALNRTLVNTAFNISSAWHKFNIAQLAATEKGVSTFLRPSEFKRMYQNHLEAVRHVDTMSPLYQELFIQHAAPFKYVGALNDANSFRDLMEGMLNNLDQSPHGEEIANGLGMTKDRLMQLGKQWADNQHLTMWRMNDVAAMTAILDRMQRGMSQEEAVKDAFKYLPSYRVTRQYKTVNALSHPNVTWFMPYHVSLFRNIGASIRDLVSTESDMAQRAKAADRLAMHALIAYGLFPVLDKITQTITGNPNASIDRFGSSKLFEYAKDIYTGKYGAVNVLARFLTPARGTEEIFEQAFNRDFFTGDQISPYYLNDVRGMWDRIKHAMTASMPIQDVESASGLPSAIVKQVGVSLPKSKGQKRMENIMEKRKQKMAIRLYWAQHNE